MFVFFQKLFCGSNSLGSRSRSSNGNHVVNRDPRGDRIFSMTILMWVGKLYNCAKNYGRTGCKRGGRKLWKISIFFWQNRSGQALDWVSLDWTKASMILGWI